MKRLLIPVVFVFSLLLWANPLWAPVFEETVQVDRSRVHAITENLMLNRCDSAGDYYTVTFPIDRDKLDYEGQQKFMAGCGGESFWDKYALDIPSDLFKKYFYRTTEIGVNKGNTVHYEAVPAYVTATMDGQGPASSEILVSEMAVAVKEDDEKRFSLAMRLPFSIQTANTEATEVFSVHLDDSRVTKVIPEISTLEPGGGPSIDKPEPFQPTIPDRTSTQEADQGEPTPAKPDSSVSWFTGSGCSIMVGLNESATLPLGFILAFLASLVPVVVRRKK